MIWPGRGGSGDLHIVANLVVEFFVLEREVVYVTAWGLKRGRLGMWTSRERPPLPGEGGLPRTGQDGLVGVLQLLRNGG